MRPRVWSAVLAVAALGSSVVAGPAAGAGASCGPAARPGGEWRSYGADLSNSRHQPAEDRIGVDSAYDLEPLWAFSIAGAGGSGGFQSTPVVADGCAFVATNSGLVFAINADTGELVWKTEAGAPGTIGGVFAVAVPGDGRVYANVGWASGPYAVALDEQTGGLVWQTPVLDETPGTITNTSAVYFDGMLFVGWAGPDANPIAHPGFALVDAANGTILKKTLVVPDEDFAAGFSGGGIWATAVVDPETKYGYVGTANPYSKHKEHRYANAILKVDLDRTRPTFGTIVDAYKGNWDGYFPGTYNQPLCQTVGPMEPAYAVSCLQLDVDFGASPTLFRNSKGEKLVGELQKAGVFHAVYADTMQQAWTALLSTPSALGNASTAAFDGRSLYVLANPGLLYALNPDTGGIRWVAPVAGGAHYQPVTVANGVVYVVSTYGTLNSYDAATGQPLMVRPLALDTSDPCVTLGGGVAVARNAVYAVCDTGAAGGGWLVAYGWDGEAPLPPLPIPY